MKEFIKKVIENNGVEPPEDCIKSFNFNFNNAINIEWFDKNTHFEAIFYKDNIEHIANFDKKGVLIEYKSFLPAGYLPEAIKIYLEKQGEIMNIILINKGNSIEYEAIIREKDMTRYLYLFSGQGKVIEQKKL